MALSRVSVSAAKVLILANKLRQPIAAGRKACPKLVESRRRSRLRGTLHDVEGVVSGLGGGNQPLFLGAEEYRNGDGRNGVLRRDCLLSDRQRLFVERLGVGVATLVGVDQSQVVEGCRKIWMVGTERLLADRQDTLRQRHSFSEFPGSIQCHYSCIQCGHLVLLRKRRRNDDSIHRQRHRYDQAESFDNVHE
jgi:hypothetical protein